MDENKPLVYFAPEQLDAEEVDRRQDRWMLYGTLFVGGLMMLSVFVLPPVVRAIRSAAARPPSPPAAVVVRPVPVTAPDARLILALEKFREEGGAYPATLSELAADGDAIPEAAGWRYVPTDDQSDYELQYVGGGPAPARR